MRAIKAGRKEFEVFLYVFTTLKMYYLISSWCSVVLTNWSNTVRYCNASKFCQKHHLHN